MHPRAALRAALAALGARGVSPTGRAIYSALWTFADPRGRAWPSQETLARMTGRCVRTVRSAVNELARVRVIVRDVPDLRERRRCRRTTAYLLLPLDAAPAARRPGAAPAAAATPAPPPADTSQPLAADAPALAWDGAEDVDLPAVDLDAHQLGADELAADGPAVEAPPVLEQGDPSREACDDGAVPLDAEGPAVDPLGAPDELAALARAGECGMVREAPAAPLPPPSITGNRRPPITGNRRREKTQGMNTSAPRPPRPSPFAAGRPPAATSPGPVQALPAPLASVLARCRALAAPSR